MLFAFAIPDGLPPEAYAVSVVMSLGCAMAILWKLHKERSKP